MSQSLEELIESPRVKSLVALIELRQYTNIMDLNTLMEMQEELSTLGESGLYDNVFEDSLYDKIFGEYQNEDDDHLPVVDSRAPSNNAMAINNDAADVSTIVKVSSTDATTRMLLP